LSQLKPRNASGRRGPGDDTIDSRTVTDGSALFASGLQRRISLKLPVDEIALEKMP